MQLNVYTYTLAAAITYTPSQRCVSEVVDIARAIVSNYVLLPLIDEPPEKTSGDEIPWSTVNGIL